MSDERKYLNYRDMKSLKEITEIRKQKMLKQSEIIQKKFDDLLNMLGEKTNKNK